MTLSNQFDLWWETTKGADSLCMVLVTSVLVIRSYQSQKKSLISPGQEGRGGGGGQYIFEMLDNKPTLGHLRNSYLLMTAPLYTKGGI